MRRAAARARRRTRRRVNIAIAAAWPKPDAPGRRWIDFQSDVTLKDVALAAHEGYVSVEHLKRYTTLGMATDQGKTANVNGLAAMAALTGREHRGDRNHHLPPALRSGADGRHRRAAPGRPHQSAEAAAARSRSIAPTARRCASTAAG